GRAQAEPRRVPRGAGGSAARRPGGSAGGHPVDSSSAHPLGVTMPRHVVLVGLPGAGKSTAGRLAAERLGAPFLDPDSLIVRRMQMPVARIFAEFGEARFRELEREAVEEALAGPPAVLVPGGGWAAQPGSLDAARGRALVIYLEVKPATAA